MKKAFFHLKKLLLFSRYLDFCLDFLTTQKNWLDQKFKANFKIHVTTWLTNNCNTHMVQMKVCQLIGYSKIILFLKMRQGDQFQTSLFIKKLYMREKQFYNFKVSLYSWQRGANPLFYEDSLYCLHPLFHILSTPSPTSLSSPAPPPLFFLLSSLFGLSIRRTLMCVLCNKESGLLRSDR